MKCVSRATDVLLIVLLLGRWGVTPSLATPTSIGETLKKQTRVIHPVGIDTVSLKLLQGLTESVVPPSKTSLTLRQGQLAVGRMAGSAKRISAGPDRQGWTLPYRILGVGKDGHDLDLQPLIEVDGGGFRPGGGGAVVRAFFATVFMAVEDSLNPTESHALEPPIRMLVTAEVDELFPRNVEFRRTNEFVEVKLRVISPRDPVRMRFVPSFDPNGSEIELAVLRGGLKISVSPQSIQGFGLETASITVRASGLPEPRGALVTLSTDRGTPGGTSLELNESGLATTTLRSITTGVATLSAEAEGAAGGTATAIFVMPWLFLGASLLGGAAGALVRWGKNRGKGGKRRGLGFDVGIGVVAGVIVAVAYAIGINLLDVRPAATAGEALVFVLAAFGGLFGIPERA